MRTSARCKAAGSILSLFTADRDAFGKPGRQRQARILQRRFWGHAIRDEGDVDYIHVNPANIAIAVAGGRLAVFDVPAVRRVGVMPATARAWSTTMYLENLANDGLRFAPLNRSKAAELFVVR